MAAHSDVDTVVAIFEKLTTVDDRNNLYIALSDLKPNYRWLTRLLVFNHYFVAYHVPT